MRRAPPRSRSKPLGRLAVWLTSVSLCVSACGASTSREEKAVLLLERMADAFEKYGDTDCEALATDLDRAIAKDGDALAALADSDRDDTARRKISKFQSRIDDATRRIVAHAKKCASDPRVSRALDAVLGGG